MGKKAVFSDFILTPQYWKKKEVKNLKGAQPQGPPSGPKETAVDFYEVDPGKRWATPNSKIFKGNVKGKKKKIAAISDEC